MTPVEFRISNLFRRYYKLTGRFLSLAVIESASGGKISDRITSVPGSSDYYKGSIISYTNEIKTRIVGVKESTILEKGAVSYQTALEMAVYGRQTLSADICLADTGIAGPTGATSKKPIGLFYIALVCSDGYQFIKKYNFHGNRINNKRSATLSALLLLEEYLINKLKSLYEMELKDKRVVTCIIKHRGKILLLRRSNKVGTYRGKWSGVSGYLEGNTLNQAYKEISEEISLKRDEITLIKKGAPISIIDENLKTKWIVYPFLFKTNSPEKIRIDWENAEMRWLKPQDIIKYDTVPGLAKVLKYVIVV